MSAADDVKARAVEVLRERLCGYWGYDLVAPEMSDDLTQTLAAASLLADTTATALAAAARDLALASPNLTPESALALLRDAAAALADPDASDCDRCDDNLAGKPEGWVAGWVAAMRFAHHAHAPEPGERFMSANGVLGAGPDAVIVDGDWLDANLADPDALASAKAGALREAADDVREYMALAWGSDRPWFTTGTKVANLVSDVLRDRADQIDPTEGTRG